MPGPLPAWKLQLYNYLHKYVEKGSPKPLGPRLPCDWCGTVPRGIKARRCCICQACGSANYCSKECRVAAWPGGHWAACGPATKMRPSEPACPTAAEDAA